MPHKRTYSRQIYQLNQLKAEGSIDCLGAKRSVREAAQKERYADILFIDLSEMSC
jgi:hypothetical protein